MLEARRARAFSRAPASSSHHPRAVQLKLPSYSPSTVTTGVVDATTEADPSSHRHTRTGPPHGSSSLPGFALPFRGNGLLPGSETASRRSALHRSLADAPSAKVLTGPLGLPATVR